MKTTTTETEPAATPGAAPVKPDKPLVVYDGSCAYCRKQIGKMQSRDDDKVFDYAPRQREGLDEQFPQLKDGDFDTGMRLIHADGSVSVGADAVYQIAKRLRGWKRLAWLYRIPLLGSLFRMGYAWIAKNRHKLAKKCEDGVCEI